MDVQADAQIHVKMGVEAHARVNAPKIVRVIVKETVVPNAANRIVE